MEYRARYNQPFTLAEAVHLDVAIITEEIARLQNSLQHLNETQALLRTHIALESDPDLQQALNENEQVIGSQNERISILRMALTQKGIPAHSSHYDLPPISGSIASTPSRSTAHATSTPAQEPTPSRTASAHASGVNQANGTNGTSTDADTSDEEGLHL
ncbi:hypothetical protein BD626DRAFT_564638 [Schizophyllum amplum]|uniref:Uncharacterized protein n=1 Tax=Schizophyllum amplum TaxID=97359 RepID=A0A550CSF6_9AGAR|nr:hypothetical protein BD626DRAFT_564638 [Auriculariopsis ampla]